MCVCAHVHMCVCAHVCVRALTCGGLFATQRTVAHEVSVSMEFSRQENWSGLPFPPPRDLPNPGIEPGSPALQADSLPLESSGKPPNLLHDIINACLFDDISI